MDDYVVSKTNWHKKPLVCILRQATSRRLTISGINSYIDFVHKNITDDICLGADGGGVEHVVGAPVVR